MFVVECVRYQEMIVLYITSSNEDTESVWSEYITMGEIGAVAGPLTTVFAACNTTLYTRRPCINSHLNSA